MTPADKPKGKPGRKTRLTPERQAKIVNAVKAGAYLETAAAAAGINKVTLHRWLRRGERYPGTIYSAFSEAVHEALAQAEMRDVLTISKAAGDGDWRAAAWRLERKYPKRWGTVSRTEITGKDGAALKIDINTDVSTLTDEQLLALAGRTATSAAGPSGTGTPPT